MAEFLYTIFVVLVPVLLRYSVETVSLILS